jgi:hypothetical protein
LALKQLFVYCQSRRVLIPIVSIQDFMTAFKGRADVSNQSVNAQQTGSGMVLLSRLKDCFRGGGRKYV